MADFFVGQAEKALGQPPCKAITSLISFIGILHNGDFVGGFVFSICYFIKTCYRCFETNIW